MELVAKSARFRHSLPSAIQSSLATTVRAINCYYSNLIEGHDTHPIEKALLGENIGIIMTIFPTNKST
jgi:hypothetical protein